MHYLRRILDHLPRYALEWEFGACFCHSTLCRRLHFPMGKYPPYVQPATLLSIILTKLCSLYYRGKTQCVLAPQYILSFGHRSPHLLMEQRYTWIVGLGQSVKSVADRPVYQVKVSARRRNVNPL
jgi:hypothetical protein